MSDQPTIDMNYWAAYNGTDDNKDGIGDTPYFYKGNRDENPLMEAVPYIPEFSSWIVLPLFLGSAFVMVFFKKKNGFGVIK